MTHNTLTITGKLGADPELRYNQSGKAVCSISIADQKAKKDDQGQWQNLSDTLWVRATLWGDDAEHAANTLHKGDTVTATGRLIARSYTTQAGERRQSLELDFPTVGVVVRAPRQQQPGHATQQPDPWATNVQPGADLEPPF